VFTRQDTVQMVVRDFKNAIHPNGKAWELTASAPDCGGAGSRPVGHFTCGVPFTFSHYAKSYLAQPAYSVASSTLLVGLFWTNTQNKSG
jgi:hypothetical protein